MINPPTVTMVRDLQPVFVEGEPDSISTYFKKSKTHFNHPVANMNTSVFGHPVQNSSSHAFKELFGIKQPKEATETVTFGVTGRPRTSDFRQGSVHESQSSEDESVRSHSHKSGSQIQYTQQLGRGDPGDSDGDDSDNGRGGNNPYKGPKKPLLPSNS